MFTPSEKGSSRLHRSREAVKGVQATLQQGMRLEFTCVNWLPCHRPNWLPCHKLNWHPCHTLNWLPCHISVQLSGQYCQSSNIGDHALHLILSFSSRLILCTELYSSITIGRLTQKLGKIVTISAKKVFPYVNVLLSNTLEKIKIM